MTSTKLITKNFRLNALANQYVSALYPVVRRQNNRYFFTTEATAQALQVDIVGNVQGMQKLVDSYLFEALEQDYRQWEDVAITTLTACIEGSVLTIHGRKIWESIVSDMEPLVAQGGRINA
ncbi:hypothetical protein [Pectobacterium cacticida]|uniref:hypothetical protein n=1 Tax=Pectobacterium cacticida TaxID=69221 RepID=UPI003985BCD5